MTIEDRKKVEIIEYRINQAFSTAEDAELLFSLNKIPAAVNRIEYSDVELLLEEMKSFLKMARKNLSQ